MEEEKIDNLGLRAIDLASVAAGLYLKNKNITPPNYDILLKYIKTEVKSAFPEAIADTKEAFAIGMNEIALETFRASMRLAGIEAAKKLIKENKENS